MSNGQSWVILDSIRDDMKSYMENNASNSEDFVFEVVNKSDVQLLSDADSKRIYDMHVSIYETSPSDFTIVSGGKSIDERQSYEVKVFFPISKNGQYDEDTERRILNARDLVFDWVQQTNDTGGTDLNSITSGNLLQLQFNGLTEPIRNERYVSCRIQMTGFRNQI